MGSTARAFLDVTSSYLAMGFLGAALFCAFTLWRDWNNGMRQTTREAWLGMVVLALGLGLNFEVTFFAFHLPSPWNNDWLWLALVVRTTLLALGILIVVRAWSRRVYHEWGWVAVVLFMVIFGHAQDMAMDWLRPLR